MSIMVVFHNYNAYMLSSDLRQLARQNNACPDTKGSKFTSSQGKASQASP